MDTIDERFEISQRKKPKLKPIIEQEDTIEIVEIIDIDTMVEKSKGPAVLEETHQPSTSNTQIIEKNLALKSLHPANQWIKRNI